MNKAQVDANLELARAKINEISSKYVFLHSFPCSTVLHFFEQGCTPVGNVTPAFKLQSAQARTRAAPVVCLVSDLRQGDLSSEAECIMLELLVSFTIS